jgi:hypothetical protein
MQHQCWGVLWRSKSKKSGVCQHLLFNSSGGATLFFKKRLAVEWIKKEYGFIRTRADLRAEPHGWRMPVPVKVTLTADGVLER